MPPVYAYIAEVIVAWVGATGTAAAIITAAVYVVGTIAVSYGLSTVLSKKLKLPSFLSDATERTQMVRQSAAPRRIIYGTVKVSGPLAFIHATGAKNEYLHLIVMLAGHEVDAIGDLYLNDELVPLDSSTPANATGKYAGSIRVSKHLGSTSQTADSDLVSETSGAWTSTDRLQGIAYIYIRLKFDQSLFPAGLPNFAAIVRGKKVYDPRTSTTAWSDNAALCLLDYMTDPVRGLGASLDEIDIPTLNASANVCDEDVTTAINFPRACDVTSGQNLVYPSTQDISQMAGLFIGMRIAGAGIPAGTRISGLQLGGPYYFEVDQYPTSTHGGTTLTFGDAEKRYELHGTVDTSERPGNVIEAMLSAMGGSSVYAGGFWFIRVAAYYTPTVTLNENDLRGPITIQTKLSRRDSLNAVKGVYVSPQNQWQPSDFPPVTNATYLAEDGGELLWRDVQLPFTTSSGTAQRLAKIELEKGRQQITVQLQCKLTALTVQAGDVVLLDNTRYGWTAKPFEVTEFKFSSYNDAEGNPALGIDLALRETASAIFDWNDGEETTIDLAPNTDLPNPFSVPTPSGLTLLADDTTGVTQGDGTFVPRLKVSWSTPNNIIVESGGLAREEYKKHSDSTWQVWNEPRGDTLEDYITDVSTGVAYDVRVQFENVQGVRGAYATVSNYTVPGKGAGPSVPSAFTATGRPEAIELNWTNPTHPDFDGIEIYELAAATPAPTSGSTPTFSVGRVNTFLRANVTAGNTGYYWIRSRNRSTNTSAWVGPASATATNGTAWVLTQVNGKNHTFYTSTAPTTGMIQGDSWFNPSHFYDHYIYDSGAWVLANKVLQEVDFGTGVEPVKTVALLPNPVAYTGANIVFLTTDKKLYRYDSVAVAWTTATDGADLVANSVTAGQLAAGAVNATVVGANQIITSAANIADAVIDSAKISSIDVGLLNAGTIYVALTLNAATINSPNINGGTITSTLLDTVELQSCIISGEAPAGEGAELQFLGPGGAPAWSLDVYSDSTFRIFRTAGGGGNIQFSADIDITDSITIGGYGYGDFTSYSTEKIKDDIRPLDDAAEILRQIRGYRFTYNGLAPKNKIGTSDLGVIAEFVRPACPELVVEDRNGMLAVNLPKITPILAEGWNIHEDRIVGHDQELLEMRMVIQGLQKEVAELRAA